MWCFVLRGYMVLEYIMCGQFIEKVDVFSFGVFLMEIVIGKFIISCSCFGIMFFFLDEVSIFIQFYLNMYNCNVVISIIVLIQLLVYILKI